MSLDIQWDHQFCLACDKQTDGATYCSESCRLADFEKTSTTSPSSGASSPALAGPAYTWGFTNPSTSSSASSRLYLTPAFDFSSSSILSTSSQSSQTHHQRPQGNSQPRVLSPSSSHASLSSMGSQRGPEACQLSDKARRELQAYASSFEHVRLQRRRSY